MKYLFTLLCTCVLISCQKNLDQISSEPISKKADQEICSFNMNEFNMSKRAPVNYDAAKGRPVSSGGKGNNGGSGGGSTTSSKSVIFLDFDGHFVSNTSWNVNGSINCLPSNLTAAEIGIVFQRVANDFMTFDVVVTTDEAVYNSANPYKRTRVIITESWEWFGQAGGVSYINSFTWGDNTPCFVFSSLLGYNVKYIAEAASHEVGHTLGLRHQSVYDANGAKITEYNGGQGTGEIGWAPIMGVSYGKNLSLWHNGTNSYNTIQNDVAIINSVLSNLSDDYSNSTSGAVALSSSLEGLVNNNSDIDFFSINISSAKNISVIPKCVGQNNEGGNLDLVLKVYSSNGALLSTINDPNILSANTTLSAGSYFLSVSTADNSNITKYGMLSKYIISLN